MGGLVGLGVAGAAAGPIGVGILIGAIAGALAGWLLSSPAPEGMQGPLTAEAMARLKARAAYIPAELESAEEWGGILNEMFVPQYCFYCGYNMPRNALRGSNICRPCGGEP